VAVTCPEVEKLGFPAVILDKYLSGLCARVHRVLAMRPVTPLLGRAALLISGQKGSRTRNGKSETNALEIERAVICSTWHLPAGQLTETRLRRAHSAGNQFKLLNGDLGPLVWALRIREENDRDLIKSLDPWTSCQSEAKYLGHRR
jgi:hypothetical protein